MAANQRRKSQRSRIIKADPLRFAAGWRLLPDPLVELDDFQENQRRPDILFDIVRPSDLVAFTVEGYDLKLVGGEKPQLRPKEGASARLVVRLPFQHLAERAIYESLAPVPNSDDPTKHSMEDTPPTPIDGENARPQPPEFARPAKTSRLVFEVPEHENIPFTIEGILKAIGHLKMLVHPLAKPRSGQMRSPADGPSFHMHGGLIANLGRDGLIITKATGRVAIPDTSSIKGIATISRDTRRVREVLVKNSGIGVEMGDAALESKVDKVRLRDKSYVVAKFFGPQALIRPDFPVQIRLRPALSRPARQLETAIEAPYRLIISPSQQGGWVHSLQPVNADRAPHRVELWHSRLGVRVESQDGTSIDERRSNQRIVRAIWARDREAMPNWQNLKVPTHTDSPFRTSLDGADRHMLVRQSAETWIGKNRRPIPPIPVDASALWWSSLGAWLNLHGEWSTDPYTKAEPDPMASILSWDHVAPMGRDQYVRVTYPGYLYPFGHRATLVKLTERKMKDAVPSIAGLYQRKFLVIGEPVKHYVQRNLPFIEVKITPQVTPTLDDPGDDQNRFFFPMVGGQRFRFILDCVDQEGRPVRLLTPLMWVADHFRPYNDIDKAYSNDMSRYVTAHGQNISFTKVQRGGDTMAPTNRLQFAGKAKLGTSTPNLVDADVQLPAIQQLSPVDPVTIKYSQIYLDHDFGGTMNCGEVWAELAGATPSLLFGASLAAGSDRAGGFLQPNLPIRGLSRIKGTIGELNEIAKGNFDPAAFLAGSLPRLFGVISLVDLLKAVGVDLNDAPNIISEALDRIEGFLSDLEGAKQAMQMAVADAQRLVQRSQDKAAEIQQKAQQTLQTIQQLHSRITTTVDQIIAQFGSLPYASENTIRNVLQNPLQTLRNLSNEMENAAPTLPPLAKHQLIKLAKILRTALDAADLIEDIFRFLNGLSPSSIQAVFRYEWKPKLQSWPSGDPILQLQEDSLVLSVDGRVSGKGEVGIEVMAELRDFTLHLLPGAPLVRVEFEHLSFHASSSAKTEVDVVFQRIEFLGVLGFVETLKDLIPFDGFSDPPYLDVTPEGLLAGFTLALPNVAVGVFNLSNISLGAEIQVPFLGKAVTVGFNFCTRERPFSLAVAFIGGGGWFMLLLSPDGLDALELGLEAGAVLAVDFGVASGSVSAMLGIYMRLEADAGSLAGYFRLRGQVDVLCLISASIELYMQLQYQFETGKMVGSARLTIKVEVFFFSTSVTISAERRFAGSTGDPNFADVMVLPDNTSPAWSEYCLAFAGE